MNVVIFKKVVDLALNSDKLTKNTLFCFECNELKHFFNFLNLNNLNYNILEGKSNFESHTEVDIELIFKNKLINSIQSDDTIIYIGNNKEEKLLAYYYANLTKRHLHCFYSVDLFMENVEQFDIRYKTFTFICEYTHRMSLQHMLGQLVPGLCFGIIIGKTIGEIANHIYKNFVAQFIKNFNIVTINRVDQLSAEENYKNFHYIPRKQATPENVKNNLIDKNNLALTIMGHGRDELIWLTNGCICGKSKFHDCDYEFTPNCVFNEKCFKKDTEIINAGDIKSNHIFVNCCCSGKISRSVFGEYYNILYSLLETNIITYIGSPFLVNGSEAIIYYYNALLNSGYHLGRICRLLNDFYTDYKIGQNNVYMLFGDPLTKNNYFNEPLLIECDINDAEKIIFNLESEISIIVINLNKNLTDEFFEYELEISAKNSRKDNIYAHVKRDRISGLTQLIIFSSSYLKEGEYTIYFNKREKFDFISIRKYNYLIDLGLGEPKLKNFLIESIRSISNYLSNKSLERLDNINNTNYSKLNKIFVRIQELSKEFTSYIRNKIQYSGFAFDDFCLSSGFSLNNSVLSEKNCPYCGNALYDNEVENKLYKLKRIHTYCVHCGNILDKPIETNIEISFNGQSLYNQGDPLIKHSIMITNNQAEDILGYVALAISNGAKENFAYDPNIYQIKLKKNETKIYDFIITHDEEIACHNYWLTAIALIDSEVYSLKRDVYFKK